jgi:gliding motility-associated-like protein
MKYIKYYTLFILIIIFVFITSHAFSQLSVTTSQPATVLASTIAGPGVTILSPTLTCPGVANGTFTATGTLLTMSSGIVLTNGHASACAGPEGALISYNNGTAGDAAMSPFLPAGVNTYDACILEFDMIASGDSIGFNYQFGSEEYRTGVCTNYTDVFAFFISGPGITGAPNIALVPGTSIPVEVNSVNDGIPGSSGGVLSNCTSLGTGSPFTSYYINNAGGSMLSYRGYTQKFRAVHAVNPCDTYHLKLSIVDAGNALYDSGVFLEAASLTTNTYSFNHSDSIGATIAATPNTIVRGCSPALVHIQAAHANASPTTLHLAFGGSAVNGTDVAPIPDTITIPADSAATTINIQALTTFATGSKVLTIYLTGGCGTLDSININIIDSPSAVILTSDTTICAGGSFQIFVAGSAGLVYSWSPASGLSSPAVMEPVCTPATSSVYTMMATLPGSGCPGITQSISVNVDSTAVNIITADTAICYGQTINLLVSGDPAYTYNWYPASGLNNTSLQDPSATPAATTTYTVDATAPGSGCVSVANITITVNNPYVTLLTPDTSVCAGTSINIIVNGDPALTYSWSPAGSLDNPAVMDPVATPSGTTNYILTTTYPGTSCTATVSFIASLIQIPASASWKAEGCNTSINLTALPYDNNYVYIWNGPNEYSSNGQTATIANPSVALDGIYSVTVTDLVNGCTAQATTLVAVTPDSLLQLTNVTPAQTVKFGTSVQLNAGNALYYRWMPEDGSLSNNNINDPVATPLQNTIYTVYGMDSSGCIDSANIAISIIYDSISIPSAFTPNNDGLNDIFRVVGMKNQKLVAFSVYNRWGQQVFTTANKEQGWNGTFNGVPQDMGVYNYMLIISLDDGNNQVYKGEVTLIR